AGVISEEIGQTLKEKDQVSQLTLLLDSAKLEINDRAERERRLEEELKEERARFALLEEEKQRKIAELEDGWARLKNLPGLRRRPFLLKLLTGLRAITQRSCSLENVQITLCLTSLLDQFVSRLKRIKRPGRFLPRLFSDPVNFQVLMAWLQYVTSMTSNILS
ncbi:unnamed protein product, partial [Cuscuta campestris]